MAARKPEITDQIRSDLRDLTSTISAMMEAFRKIRKPIQESYEKVPTSAHHLENVTEQTEQATNKVLDMVEAITNRESQIREWLQRLREMIARGKPGQNDDLKELLDHVEAGSQANLNDSYAIMDALQFQDITTQQIDHAITLLDDVEEKLTAMLITVGEQVKKSSVPRDKKKRVFDPNAKFEIDNPNQQKEIDNIISSLE
jgi:chemotaxis regulatin CheY-phosphate phosphatase CheZ